MAPYIYRCCLRRYIIAHFLITSYNANYSVLRVFGGFINLQYLRLKQKKRERKKKHKKVMSFCTVFLGIFFNLCLGICLYIKCWVKLGTRFAVFALFCGLNQAPPFCRSGDRLFFNFISHFASRQLVYRILLSLLLLCFYFTIQL